MNIKVSRTSLLSKLRVVSKALKNSNDFAYTSFLITPANGYIRITASDETGRIETKVECVIEALEEKPFLLEASKLMAGLRDIPEQPIVIEVKEKQVTVRYNKGKFELAKHDASIYPSMKKIENEPISLDNEILGKGLESVVKFASKDDILRPVMGSVNMSYADGTLTFAGTNSHVLSVYEHDCNDIPEFKINVPARYAKIITDLIPSEGSSNMAFDNRSAAFETEDYWISYRLIEGQYPNFKSVIPKSANIEIELNCAELLSAVSRVSVFSNEASSLIVFTLEVNKLTLSTENESYSQRAQEAIEVQRGGRDIQIGFNGQFLVDILKTMQMYGNSCTFELTEPSRPGLIKPINSVGEELSIVLMPLVINN